MRRCEEERLPVRTARERVHSRWQQHRRRRTEQHDAGQVENRAEPAAVTIRSERRACRIEPSSSASVMGGASQHRFGLAQRPVGHHGDDAVAGLHPGLAVGMITSPLSHDGADQHAFGHADLAAAGPLTRREPSRASASITSPKSSRSV